MFYTDGVIETADRDVDDRTVAHLLANPAEDGGQWNMFVALVRKHGLVPKSAMPETHSSSKTGMLNRSIGQLMRRTARDLRQQAANGASVEQLRDLASKEGVTLGEPAPAEDKNGFVVTRMTADELGLRTVSDLAKAPRELVLGGPPECPSRPLCGIGLQETYGITVKS